MERWPCADCGTRVPILEERCPSCGYERTDYDLAGAAEETGSYLISRISIPGVNFGEFGPSLFKILIALIIGTGIGGVVIFLLERLM